MVCCITDGVHSRMFACVCDRVSLCLFVCLSVCVYVCALCGYVCALCVCALPLGLFLFSICFIAMDTFVNNDFLQELQNVMLNAAYMRRREGLMQLVSSANALFGKVGVKFVIASLVVATHRSKTTPRHLHISPARIVSGHRHTRTSFAKEENMDTRPTTHQINNKMKPSSVQVKRQLS